MWSGYGYGYGYGYAALSFNVTHISTCYGYTVTDSYPATLAVLFNISLFATTVQEKNTRNKKRK